jgi:hypothetical protein
MRDDPGDVSAGQHSAPLMRWLEISSSPWMQLAYTRKSTSTEWPARRATGDAGTPASNLIPASRFSADGPQLSVGLCGPTQRVDLANVDEQLPH